MTDFRGTFCPLPRSELEKTKAGDPRPSIASLYSSREHYLAKVRSAADELVAEGFLLAEDKAYVIERSKGYWSWIFDWGSN